MTKNLLTRSDGRIQALCSLDSPRLAGLLDCLSVLIAPRVGKMGCLGSSSPHLSPHGGWQGLTKYNTIQCIRLLTAPYTPLKMTAGRVNNSFEPTGRENRNCP